MEIILVDQNGKIHADLMSTVEYEDGDKIWCHCDLCEFKHVHGEVHEDILSEKEE